MRLKRFLRSVSCCMPLHRRTNTTRGGAHASQVRLLPASASASMHTCTCSLTATPMHYVYTFSHAVLYLDARTHRTFLTTRTHCAHVFTRCLSHLQGLRVPPHSQPKVYLHTRICRCAPARARKRPHAHVHMNTRTRAYNRTSTCTQRLHISTRTHHMPLPPSLRVSALLSICIYARHMHTYANVRERARQFHGIGPNRLPAVRSPTTSYP